MVMLVRAFYLAAAQFQVAQYKNEQFPSLVELRAVQQARLNTAHWVDKSNQVVAIPIDQAMKIMIETQGNFPSTQPTTRPATQPTTVPTTQPRPSE